MADDESTKGSNCPHCGKPVAVRWTSLLPSNDRKRSFKCASCGGLYDLSDGSKIASILAGVLGMGPGVLLFGRITRGHSGAVGSLLGTLAVLAAFCLFSMAAGRIALRLVPKR
jgi:hypothetical protein